jgi:hypothetical protein
MDKNKRFYNDDDTPVCRFGPGGDFFTDWPDKKVSKVSRQPIGSVLKAIAKMLDTVITEELLQNSTLEKINLAVNGTLLSTDTEDKIDIDKSIYGEQSRTNEPDASAITGPEADRQLPKEPMLFDNASGTVAGTGHKSNNSIRAHRRPKRKRIAFGTIRQGSLFEPHPESSKVA